MAQTNMDTEKALIVNNIELFRKINKSLDYYLEEILLLFPSFFFFQKDDIELVQICINLCKKLIKQTNDENLIKREENLKQKLLLFLYSIDESKNEIININDIINKDLKLEIDFLKEIRTKNKTIKNFENLLQNASNEMKLYIYREIAIIHFKNKNYNDCMDNLKNILNLEDINNIYKNRLILDCICTFLKKCKKENNQTENQIIEGTKNDINENYKLIKEKIKELNEIIKRPLQKNIYEEAFKLRDKIYDDLLQPDIIMLNSNSIKNISNNNYSLNNQYYILDKLSRDINKHIRIKSYVLNNDNLSKALNEKGEILIIQSDDYTFNGEIVYESKNGESEILKLDNLISITKNKKINYKIIILCFQNSNKIKDYFNNCPYVISFNYFNNLNLK